MNRFLIFSLLILSSCSEKYLAFTKSYQFKSDDGKPHYDELNYWAAHPWKNDPSDSIPLTLRNGVADSVTDVFFLHPTTFTKRKDRNKPNAQIDDAYLGAKTDYTTILYQASVFNEQSRVFAPRYRQAHIYNFFKKNKQEAAAAFDIAYEDIRASFEYYMKHWNKGRPIIIASHSQGSMLAERLLKDYFENKPLSKQLVAAYVAGWGVPKEYFSSLKMCDDSLQTGCICSWRTLRRGFIPPLLKSENGNSYVTNPLNWSTTDKYARRSENKGSVLKNFNKIFLATTDAWVSNGFLYVKRPKFPFSFLYIKRNYHIGDINLFYVNVRNNVRQRIASYHRKQK